MKMRLILMTTLLLAVLMGCSAPHGSSDGRLQVVASFYPLAYAAQQVGGSRVDVTNLTAPGVEPHDLELTPDAVQSISTADLVIMLGGGFQPAVQDATKDASGTVLDVLTGVTTEPPPPGTAEPGLTIDPHVWLDPVRYSAIVAEVAHALDALEPASASRFDAAAASFRAGLATLDGQYRSGLSSCTRTTIVTSHAAFGYLAARYGLVQVPIAGISPEAEPSAQQIADLAALVQGEGITTIFTETLVSTKVADTLAQQAGVATAVLDPLESLTPSEASAGEDYISVMDTNLATLTTALGCG